MLINVGSTALLLVANHMSTIIIGSTFFPVAIVSRITFLGINFRNFPHGKSVRQNMIKRKETFNNISAISCRSFSLEMPVASQSHYGFHSFPVVD